jgi:hypothetical protein
MSDETPTPDKIAGDDDRIVYSLEDEADLVTLWEAWGSGLILGLLFGVPAGIMLTKILPLSDRPVLRRAGQLGRELIRMSPPAAALLSPTLRIPIPISRSEVSHVRSLRRSRTGLRGLAGACADLTAIPTVMPAGCLRRA